MLNRKATIFVLVLSILLFIGGLGSYYYYKVIKPSQTTQTAEASTEIKTDAQVKNDKLKDEVIRTTPEPEGIAQPKYVPAPTPPAPAS